MRCHLATSLAIAIVSAATGQAATACGESEGDRLNWARERMFPGNPDMRLVYRWLDNATKSCSNSGDLWYYRALVAAQLKDEPDEKYSLKKARENNSAALARKLNPFAPRDLPQRPSAAGAREKYALVIGVGAFLHYDKPLAYSEKDAKDFAAILQSKYGAFKPGNVTLLTEGLATTRNIKEAFANIREKAQEQDLVVVYISSHGWPRKDDPTGLSFILTRDSETKSQSEVYATSLQMVEVAEFGRWLRARQFVLFLDTCFSGSASPPTKPASGIQTVTSAFAQLEGTGSRVVISASQADEQSWEDTEHENGYFTRFLLEGLKQRDGHNTLGDVFRYVQERVSAVVQKEQGSFQHPVIGSFGQGDKLMLNPAGNVARLPISSPLPSLLPLTARSR